MPNHLIQASRVLTNKNSQTSTLGPFLKALLVNLAVIMMVVMSIKFALAPSTDIHQATLKVEKKNAIIQASLISGNAIAARKKEKAGALELQAAIKEQKKQNAILENKRHAEEYRLKTIAVARKKEAEEKRLIAAQLEQQDQQQRIANIIQRAVAEYKGTDEPRLVNPRPERASIRQRSDDLPYHTGLIMQTMRRNLSTGGRYKGKTCTLNIKFAPTGKVLSVAKISGSRGLCKAGINAVLKPKSFPVPSDPILFAKLQNINLLVQP